MPNTSMRDASLRPQLSVVIPLFNEEGTLDELHRRLTATLGKLDLTYEIVFVDDGSTDGTYFGLRAIGASDRNIRVVKLTRNYGQTAALAAGFDNAQGAIIVAMDGDLQHAPEDLPRLLDKLDEAHDVVSGWRQRRLDNYWTRRLPSQVANWLIAKCSGVKLRDFGHDIQGVPQIGDQTNQAVRRSAPLHPRLGERARSAHCGSANHRCEALAEQVPLRVVANSGV